MLNPPSSGRPGTSSLVMPAVASTPSVNFPNSAKASSNLSKSDASEEPSSLLKSELEAELSLSDSVELSSQPWHHQKPFQHHVRGQVLYSVWLALQVGHRVHKSEGDGSALHLTAQPQGWAVSASGFFSPVPCAPTVVQLRVTTELISKSAGYQQAGCPVLLQQHHGILFFLSWKTPCLVFHRLICLLENLDNVFFIVKLT